MIGRRPSAGPQVALETAFLTTGLPAEVALTTARAMADTVRERRAEPAYAGVIGGDAVVGLDDENLERLARSGRKIAARDLPVAMARGWDGGTTVSATLFLARSSRITVAATGGIGGVHPAGSGVDARDESADLVELSRSPLVLVCSGAKAILDLPATVERLETLGVTVVGYGTDELPAFWSARSGIPLPHRVEDAAEASGVARAARISGLPGAILVCVPPPVEVALSRGESEEAVTRAQEDAIRLGMVGAALTPFLLSRIAEITAGRSLAANRALLENNAAVAAGIAVALAEEE